MRTSREAPKQKGLFSRKWEKRNRNANRNLSSHPNLMFPVSGRELAPGGLDI
jgi:hypothetical protein